MENNEFCLVHIDKDHEIDSDAQKMIKKNPQEVAEIFNCISSSDNNQAASSIQVVMHIHMTAH